VSFVSTVIQRPTGSGFGPGTTAADVLAGRDLSGSRVLVTGAYAGIGRATTTALVAAGATVLVPARRPDVATEALAGLDNVEIGSLDLADLGSVSAYAAGLLADGRPLDRVIANAGIMACPETRVADGWEAQLATNHLGHFALVNRVLPLLRTPARVVCLTSLGHHYSPMRWEDPWFRTGYQKWPAYGQSKTAVMLFARHLDRVGRDRGISSYSVHPGAIITELGKYLTAEDLDELLVVGEDGNRLMPDFKSPEAGAATALWAAYADLPADRGGAYLEDCDVAGWAAEGRTGTGAKPYALDDAEAARLWAWSADLTGVNAFEGG
jgi:NAD(P)-dependent dehydrogenase (short-subunit alcohol dehydrogenase family)